MIRDNSGVFLNTQYITSAVYKSHHLFKYHIICSYIISCSYCIICSSSAIHTSRSLFIYPIIYSYITSSVRACSYITPIISPIFFLQKTWNFEIITLSSIVQICCIADQAACSGFPFYGIFTFEGSSFIGSKFGGAT